MRKIHLYLLFLLLVWSGCQKDTSSGETGTGGSMARFTIKDSYLYTVDDENLHTFSISDPSDVKRLSKQHLGFGIETIFPSGEFLFMGAMNGMHIYDLTNPSQPKRRSFTPHFVSYDPVVVKDNYAFVTLRTFGDRNQLLVFDISSPDSPFLLAEYDMVGPRGLGIDGDLLFLCDDVLKVFKITEGFKITQIHSFNVSAIDVIPSGNVLYVVAEDGLYQYSYSGDDISLISKITIPPKS